ncbi:MAG TPA: MG2 domain-containing protein, partial [Armatimonadota bacterium]|nr:MG2 domain-containing protein [Armatimonadota bacterium]
LYVHSHANLPGEDPRVAVRGFREGDELTLRLLAIDPMLLIEDRGAKVRSLLTPVSTRTRPGAAAALRSAKVRQVREWTHRVRNRDAEGAFYDYVRLGAIPQGVYLVTATGAKDEGLGWLMVTDLAVVTKAAAGRVIAFSTNLRTGAVVPNADLVFYSGVKPIARGKTDGQGLGTFNLGKVNDQAAVVARRGQSVTFLHFDPQGAAEGQRYRVFTYTDRPVYRPGHKVRFKGVVRRLQGDGYAVPSPRTVQVQVKDQLDTVLYDQDVRLTDRGSFAGQVDLPSEVQAGLYTLRVKIDGEEHADEFAVASYRKPEWKVEVKTPNPRYVRGERIPVTVHAEYYYGAPVSEGKVRYTVYRSQYWSWYGEGEEEYPVEDGEDGYSAGGEVVDTGEKPVGPDGTVE